jgi:hypothetical protein
MKPCIDRLPSTFLSNVVVLWLVVPFLAACGGGGGSDDGVPQTMTLTAYALTPGEVRIEWTAHPELIIGYDLYRDGASAYPYHLSGTGYTDRGLAPSTRYCYFVYAVSILGIEGRSNQACVTTPALAGWSIETVGAGDSPGLALDAANQRHVSYRSTDGIMLAVKTGAWQYSVVDANAGGFGDTDVQVDRNSANHLSYWDYTNARLMAATDATGVWISELVDNGGNVNALALDGAGNAHLLYNIHEDGTINYATNASGAWVSQWLAGFSSGTIYDTDILVDNGGVVHALFAIGSPQACYVYYLTNPGGVWSDQVIASDTNCGAALARASTGALHVAYSTRFGLTHAFFTGGVWQSEQLDSFSWIGGDRVALAIDSDNHLHIAYSDQNLALKYAGNSSGSWELAYVDGGGSYDPSIVVDPLGRVSIAYADETRGTVKLATSP